MDRFKHSRWETQVVHLKIAHVHSQDTSDGMRPRSCIACAPAILKSASNSSRSSPARYPVWRHPHQTYLAPRCSFASPSSTLVKPDHLSQSSQTDGITDQDDRWRAAYLESLMKNAGELSVKGMPESALVVTSNPASHFSHDNRRKWQSESRERHLSEDGSLQATRC